MSRVFTIAALVLLALAGPALLVVGSVLRNGDETLRAHGTHASGVVVQFSDTMSQRNRKLTVQYVDQAGESHQVEANAGSGQHPQPGEPAEVVYDPAEPGRALVTGYDSSNTVVLGIGVVLTLLDVFVLVVVLVGRRRRRKRAAA